MQVTAYKAKDGTLHGSKAEQELYDAALLFNTNVRALATYIESVTPIRNDIGGHRALLGVGAIDLVLRDAMIHRPELVLNALGATERCRELMVEVRKGKKKANIGQQILDALPKQFADRLAVKVKDSTPSEYKKKVSAVVKKSAAPKAKVMAKGRKVTSKGR